MLLCEVACYAKSLNKTLCDLMIELYEKYGYYQESLLSFTLKGIDGSQKINNIMKSLRENKLLNVSDEKIIAIRDYLNDERENLLENKAEKMNMPQSNVLYYELENNGWFCVRPSGTEPKIKIYMGVKEYSLDKSITKIKNLEKEIKAIIESKI